MVPTSRRASPSLSERLFSEADRFEFFQAVRLLEIVFRERTARGSTPPRFPVGHDYLPSQEAVRFRAHSSLRFPSNPIVALREHEVDESHPAAPPEMVVSFMGLTGPAGALPQHYTQLLIDRVRERDPSLKAFLDLFNHRAISLLYRAWEKYRFAIVHERSKIVEDADGEEDLFTRCIFCIVGMGTSHLRGRTAVADESFLYYAGHFAHFPRSAVSLELMLGDYFVLPLWVEQFQGQWLYLAQHDRSLLPSALDSLGQNCQLGTNLIVGERVWDVRSKFRIRIGPLTYDRFREFMPSGKALWRLVQLTRTYVGPDLDFDVQPLLKSSEVPPCRIRGDGADAARLGWNTWMLSEEPERDAEDAVFCLNEV